MTNAAPVFDLFFLGVVPYAAVTVFLMASIWRYRVMRFSFSSLGSQFLENRQHFFGLVPFHYGMLAVLTGHLVAFLLPRGVLAWNGQPVRLYLLEITALAFGLMTLVGLFAVIVRRGTTATVRAVTNGRDWIVLALLLLQTASGVAIAVSYPWGSSWFAIAAVPYLRSLFTFAPAYAGLAAMPWLIKLHFVNGFVLLAFAPFSRLVHVLVAPLPYLWRKPQVVRWYRRPEIAA